MMQFCHFFIKFIESDQKIFIKIEIGNKDDLCFWCNWHNPNVNFSEKFLLYFKKLYEKDKIWSIFKKSEPNGD